MSGEVVDPGRRTLVLAAVSLGTAALVGPLVRDVLPSDQLHLREPEVLSDSGSVTVRVAVTGGARPGTLVRVWWTLTAEGAAEPAWRSPVVTEVFDPDDTVVEVADTPDGLTGPHRLDVWLHGKRRTTFVHHDHAAFHLSLGGS